LIVADVSLNDARLTGDCLLVGQVVRAGDPAYLQPANNTAAPLRSLFQNEDDYFPPIDCTGSRQPKSAERKCTKT